MMADVLEKLQEYLVFDDNVPISSCLKSYSHNGVDKSHILIYFVHSLQGIGQESGVNKGVERDDVEVYEL